MGNDYLDKAKEWTLDLTTETMRLTIFMTNLGDLKILFQISFIVLRKTETANYMETILKKLQNKKDLFRIEDFRERTRDQEAPGQYSLKLKTFLELINFYKLPNRVQNDLAETRMKKN